MGMTGEVALVLAKKYVQATAVGLGAVKGAPATIQQIADIDGGHRITFEWIGTEGTQQTSTLDVMNGHDGDKGDPGYTPVKGTDYFDGKDGDPGYSPTITVTNIAGGHKVTVTNEDESTSFNVMDGQPFTYDDFTREQLEDLKGTDGISPTVTITEATGGHIVSFTDKDGVKSFVVKDGTGFDADNYYTKDEVNTALEGKASTDAIPTVPVNVSELNNDENYINNTVDNLVNYYVKSDIYTKSEVDDLISNIQKLTSQIVDQLPTENIDPSVIYLIKAGDTSAYIQHMYINDAWVELGSTQVDLSDYYKKTEIDMKLADKVSRTELPIVPTKVSELTNDSNFVTETELNQKGYLTEHQDISGKVDKDEGKSLIADSEITRLSTVKNYDDSVIKEDIATIKSDYATKTYVGEQIATAGHLKREIVTEVPTVETATENVIYMLKVESTVGADKYKEYMLIDGEVACVGDTSVDLTDYAKKSEIPTELPANGGNADTAASVPWSGVTGKPSSYTPSAHNHDDRYYTESEMDTKLNGKVDLSADGVSKAINQLSTGTSTPIDADYYVSQYSGGGTTTTSYHRRPMSALWSYIKGKADKVYSALGHKHTKSEITDFPSSMPASDVYSWAKASSKPSYTKSEVGLGDVDNTSDVNKPVSTAQKKEFDRVNSNLTDLKVSDVAGGKNLADINAFKQLTIAEKSDRYGYEWLDMKGGSYTFTITANGDARVYLGYEHEGVVTNPYSVGNETANFTITIDDHDSIAVWFDEKVKTNSITKIQLEEGTTATEYEPYVPSVKMLADTLTADVAAIKKDVDSKASSSNPAFIGSISLGRKSGSTIGTSSVAEGDLVVASEDCSHAEGYSTTASGKYSHAEGASTQASGNYSHAEGAQTVASGRYSHAEGDLVVASGDCSHAEGANTQAKGMQSHAEGLGTIASGKRQHVEGQYNVEDTENKYVHIIGSGTNSSKRKNIHTVDWSGNAEYAGDVTATSSDGNKTNLLETIHKVYSMAIGNSAIEPVVINDFKIDPGYRYLYIINGSGTTGYEVGILMFINGMKFVPLSSSDSATAIKDSVSAIGIDIYIEQGQLKVSRSATSYGATCVIYKLG